MRSLNELREDLLVGVGQGKRVDVLGGHSGVNEAIIDRNDAQAVCMRVREA